jgi:hypothetical protein
MARYTGQTAVRVEFFGGPLDGVISDKSELCELNGFLPSVLHEDHNKVTPAVVVLYAADTVKPVTARGTHRYNYRP